ncbi:glutamate synthase subunit beta [Bifidobacterium aquikefiricola]|uniref:Glutamate synthase subunit beta n=1 Tax=Bifidobacterium aquikefiricola TaxID=3059038 RepID=A0AB39U936_9BIFI
MTDPRGFLKVRTRRELKERPVSERTKDWQDVHAEFGLQDFTKSQAARCMDCGTPFCMTGCPLGNLIPEFNDLVRQGKWEDGYNRLSVTNNFPEVTGRVCPAPCEQACVLAIHQPATMIKLDEQTIIDQAWKLGYVKPQPPQRLTDMTVAVVGSGPAGLACAQQLTRAGHTVVVYERDDAIGGLMRYGIPNFKLDKTLIDKRQEQMEAEGTRFRTNVEIGKDISWDELRSRYDAVVVAIGSTVPRNISIPGRELKGIHFAMDFLPDATRAVWGKKPINGITAKDKHVVIIGGGDTGSDCLGTSIRQGARSVTVLQINPKEPATRPDKDPWPTYARTYQKTSSMEEGGEYLYSTDSVEFEAGEAGDTAVDVKEGTTAESFIADEHGSITGLKIVDVAPGDNGPFTRQHGTERIIPADLVLISIGFLHPDTQTLVDQLPVELDKRGNVARNNDFATSQDGMFVCGDAGRGQSLVVWAISEGRSCAAAVDKFLTGNTELPAPITATQRPMMLPR